MLKVLRHGPQLGRALPALALLLALAGCGAPAANTPTAPALPAATTVPQASAVAPTAPPTPAPAAQATPAPDAAAAVQTLLAYYNGINQQQYEASYRLWAGDGAASGQTLAQFEQGYAKTVRADLQLGEPRPAANGAVELPATILAVVNSPGITEDQTIEQYAGSYMLAPSAGGWHITSASIAATSGALPPTGLATPEAALQAYYDAINQRAIAHAFTLWGGNGQASQQTFGQFAAGYASTASVTIALGKGQSNGAAGSVYTDIPVVLNATNADGSQQTFCGTYTLRRANVPPFDKLGWRIEGAQVAEHARVPAGSAAEQQLLANGCG